MTRSTHPGRRPHRERAARGALNTHRGLRDGGLLPEGPQSWESASRSGSCLCELMVDLHYLVAGDLLRSTASRRTDPSSLRAEACARVREAFEQASSEFGEECAFLERAAAGEEKPR